MTPAIENGMDTGAQSGWGGPECVDSLTLLRRMPEAPSECEVCVVGAGPAGLMLASNLARFGVRVTVIDDRADQTAVGRADGLQPKTIETFRQMRLADPLLQRGVRVYDIAFWRSTPEEPLHRLGREVHYPPVIDVLDPYILLVHQGVVEGLFIEDLRRRGVEVRRNTAFDSYSLFCDSGLIGSGIASKAEAPLQVNCRANVTQDRKRILARYLVGCDGAHSKVRKSIPDARPIGSSQPSVWGVLDGELETDFPDIWSKTLVFSQEGGSILIIPRERNMTRLYIELKTSPKSEGGGAQLGQDFVMQRARDIMAPFEVRWRYVEWFGRYQIGQRVAARFTDPHQRAFLAGDASHTHSPKAAQGMNTSMHDAWNLAWKLNLAVRGLARPALLQSYEEERRKVALDLVNFDYEHATRIAGGDAVALADNFRTNVRFISGVGAEYGENAVNMPTDGSVSTMPPPPPHTTTSAATTPTTATASTTTTNTTTTDTATTNSTNNNTNIHANINQSSGSGASSASVSAAASAVFASAAGPVMGEAKPGALLPPAKVTRYVDSNPVDVQLDIPMLGQFRIYLLMWDVHQSRVFLETFCQAVASPQSLVRRLSGAAKMSYARQPRLPAPEDIYLRPERYTAVSHLFTFALITTMPKSEIEVSDLPALFQDSRWTFYLDDVPELDTRGALCTDKWLGSLGPGEVAIVNVRPDGYVGSIGRWDSSVDDTGEEAARWLDAYYDRFLQLPEAGSPSPSPEARMEG